MDSSLMDRLKRQKKELLGAFAKEKGGEGAEARQHSVPKWEHRSAQGTARRRPSLRNLAFAQVKRQVRRAQKFVERTLPPRRRARSFSFMATDGDGRVSFEAGSPRRSGRHTQLIPYALGDVELSHHIGNHLALRLARDFAAQRDDAVSDVDLQRLFVALGEWKLDESLVHGFADLFVGSLCHGSSVSRRARGRARLWNWLKTVT
jgi:hypothetical protein